MDGYRRRRPLLIAVLSLQLASCGYLIFPERTGQSPGRIDWSVVGLDAVGLLFGIVPGVIAFAVDFGTGCIYLPAAPYAAVDADAGANGSDQWMPMSASPGVPVSWEMVAVVDEVRPDAVAKAVAARIGRAGDVTELEQAIRWQTNAPAGWF